MTAPAGRAVKQRSYCSCWCKGHYRVQNSPGQLSSLCGLVLHFNSDHMARIDEVGGSPGSYLNAPYMCPFHSELSQSKSCNHIWSPRSREEQFWECAEGEELEVLEKYIEACRGILLSSSWHPHVHVPPDSNASKKWNYQAEVSGHKLHNKSRTCPCFYKNSWHDCAYLICYIPGHVMLTVTSLIDLHCSSINTVWRLNYLWPWERGVPVSIHFCVPYWKHVTTWQTFCSKFMYYFVLHSWIDDG